MITVDFDNDYLAMIGDIEMISEDLVYAIRKYAEIAINEPDLKPIQALASVLTVAVSNAMEQEPTVAETIGEAIFMAADALLNHLDFDGMNKPENVYQTNSPFTNKSTKSILKTMSDSSWGGDKKRKSK